MKKISDVRNQLDTTGYVTLTNVGSESRSYRLYPMPVDDEGKVSHERLHQWLATADGTQCDEEDGQYLIAHGATFGDLLNEWILLITSWMWVNENGKKWTRYVFRYKDVDHAGPIRYTTWEWWDTPLPAHRSPENMLVVLRC